MPAESQGDDTCIVFVKKLFPVSIEWPDSNQLKLKMPLIVRTQRFVMGLKNRKFAEAGPLKRLEPGKPGDQLFPQYAQGPYAPSFAPSFL